MTIQTNEWTCGYEDQESDPRVVKRMAQVRDLTVFDLIAWCGAHDMSIKNVTVTSTHLKWSSPEMEEEREKRIEHEKDREARTEKWERETLDRLTKKYGAKP